MYLIEALVRWTEFSSTPAEEQDEVRRLIDPDYSPDKAKITAKYEYSRMIFDLGDVKMFNEGYQDGMTVLRFDDGETLVIKVEYEEFRTIFATYNNQMVNQISANEPDQKRLVNRKKRKEDRDTDLGID